MNSKEAKQLLELSRPGNQDDRKDPLLAEAFALLEVDAELKAWFQEQQAVDARISDHISSIEIPADLRSNILTGMRLHSAHVSDEVAEESTQLPQKPASTSAQQAWWKNPWTGIAALFAILMVILTLQSNKQGSIQVTESNLPSVIKYLSQEISELQLSQFDKRDNNASTLQAFLASSDAPSPLNIPQGLEQMPTIGCITYNYNNETKLSMICFKNGEVYHLITADKASYPDALPEEPQFYQCGDKAFKLWIEGEQVKILSTLGKKEDMPEFI